MIIWDVARNVVLWVNIVVANHAWMPSTAEYLNLIATKIVLWATFAAILYV